MFAMFSDRSACLSRTEDTVFTWLLQAQCHTRKCSVWSRIQSYLSLTTEAVSMALKHDLKMACSGINSASWENVSSNFSFAQFPTVLCRM